MNVEGSKQTLLKCGGVALHLLLLWCLWLREHETLRRKVPSRDFELIQNYDQKVKTLVSVCCSTFSLWIFFLLGCDQCYECKPSNLLPSRSGLCSDQYSDQRDLQGGLCHADTGSTSWLGLRKWWWTVPWQQVSPSYISVHTQFITYNITTHTCPHVGSRRKIIPLLKIKKLHFFPAQIVVLLSV